MPRAATLAWAGDGMHWDGWRNDQGWGWTQRRFASDCSPVCLWIYVPTTRS